MSVQPARRRARQHPAALHDPDRFAQGRGHSRLRLRRQGTLGIDGEQNFAYVKPAKEDLETNLNLVTAGRQRLRFILAEVSARPERPPDLKVFVEPSDPRYGGGRSRAQATRLRRGTRGLAQQVQRAKDDSDTTQRDKQEAAIDAWHHRLRRAMCALPIAFEAGKKPFNVRAMYHDDRFTYIQARPEETPTLDGARDGKPNLVNFSYPKTATWPTGSSTAATLVIGKEKLPFSREE